MQRRRLSRANASTGHVIASGLDMHCHDQASLGSHEFPRVNRSAPHPVVGSAAGPIDHFEGRVSHGRDSHQQSEFVTRLPFPSRPDVRQRADYNDRQQSDSK